MTDKPIPPARYTTRQNPTNKQWEIVDHATGATFGRFQTNFQAGRRATELQMKHNQRLRENYGMQHPMPAPPARAYRDN